MALCRLHFQTGDVHASFVGGKEDSKYGPSGFWKIPKPLIGWNSEPFQVGKGHLGEQGCQDNLGGMLLQP